jgi:hypothetical protein
VIGLTVANASSQHAVLSVAPASPGHFSADHRQWYVSARDTG